MFRGRRPRGRPCCVTFIDLSMLLVLLPLKPAGGSRSCFGSLQAPSKPMEQSSWSVEKQGEEEPNHCLRVVFHLPLTLSCSFSSNPLFPYPPLLRYHFSFLSFCFLAKLCPFAQFKISSSGRFVGVFQFSVCFSLYQFFQLRMHVFSLFFTSSPHEITPVLTSFPLNCRYTLPGFFRRTVYSSLF